jgi:hypothetical protein
MNVSKLNLPSRVAGAVPSSDRRSRRDGLSMIAKSSDSAADAIVKWNNFGVTWEAAVAAIVTERMTLIIGQRSSSHPR